MKRFWLSLLALMLALSMLLCCFVSCNKDEDTEPPADDSGDDTTPPAEEEQGYVHSENYLSDSAFSTLKTALEAKDPAFAALDDTMAPAISMNIEILSDCSITAISIPVFKTLAADGFGAFSYTIGVVDSSLAGMRSAPVSGITLAIDANQYDLSENAYIYRYITVDLSKTPIELGAGQTLALGAPDDTLIAAYVKTQESDISTYLKKNCGEPGMFKKGGSADLDYDRDLLCFDFKMEQTFEDEAAYQKYAAELKAAEDAFAAKVQALKDAGYKGKKISIMGDSISTFAGVSNNAEINLNLAGHSSHNTKDSNVCDWTLTYWGRLAVALEMELCVINSWSGSKVFGSETDENKGYGTTDNMLERADQLHRDGGTENDPTDDTQPDLIILYMGINDVLNSPWGTLPEELAATNDQQALMASWITEVRDRGSAYTPGMTVYPCTHEETASCSCLYKSWQAAYALSLDLIKATYPNAEICIMTLVESNAHSSGKKVHIDRANICLRALAEYYDCTLIDQQNNGYITKQNSYLYCHDQEENISSIHPNLKGHELMMRLIVDELYKNLPKS